ncbi:MAG: rod shape-determining protein MreC [Patescibacteria group bacterium]
MRLRSVDRQVWLRWRGWVLLLLILLFLDLVGLGKSLQNITVKISAPVQHLNARVVNFLVKPVQSWRNFNKTAQKIQDLELRYAEVSAQLSELDRLKSENEVLRSMLENSDRKLARSRIAAPILSYAQPTISVGTKDEVKTGMMVMFAGTLLGIIDQAEENVATVSLLDQLTSQPIIVKTESGVQGLIRGDGRRVMLTDVSIEKPLNLNERVVTVGQKGVEGGIFVGRIRKIETKPSDSAQSAVIDQLISFYEVSLVEVR